MNHYPILQHLLATLDAHPLLERLFFASAELAILGVVVAAAITCLRIRSPRACAILWLIVLAKPIVTLACGAAFPVLRLAPPAPTSVTVVPPAQTAPSNPDTIFPSGKESVTTPVMLSTPKDAVVPPPAVPAPLSMEAVVPSMRDWAPAMPDAFGLLWLAGVVVLVLTTLIDRGRLVRFMARTSPPMSPALDALRRCAEEMNLRRTPPLRITREIESPAVVGWFRPVIVLPRWLGEPGNENALAWALRHELTHLKHRDPIANALRRLAQILFFFHPVTWWASRRWEAAVELACDRAVVNTDDDVTAYAEQLYAILVQARQQRQRTMATGLFATRTQINTRIAALLGNSLNTPARLGIAAAIALTLFAGTVFAVGGAIAEKEEVEVADAGQDSGTTTDSETPNTSLPARTLPFPQDRSLGTVWIGDPIDYAYTPDQKPEMNEAGGWVNLGEAKGKVEIPAGKAVWLDVGPKRQAVDLAALASLPPNGVQYLDLYRLPIGDDDLRHILPLTELEALSLYSTEVTDAGLTHIAALPNIRWLDLGATKIEGSGLGQLAQCKGLVHLDLNYIKLNGGPTAKEVGMLTSLQWLDLSGCEVTAQDLKDISGLKNLVTLDLEYSHLGNDDLKHLLTLERLQHLILDRTRIDEGYKEQLAGLPNLKSISVENTTAPEAKTRVVLLGGRVVNEAGEPIEGVEVDLYGNFPDKVGMAGEQVTSDKDGRWVVRIPNGWTNLMVNASHPDYISDVVMGIRPLPPEGQLRDHTATLIMKKGTTFSGAVVDGAGRPIPGAYVLHGYYHGELDKIAEGENVTVADGEGRFTIANLDKRRHEELAVFTMNHGPEVVRLDYGASDQPIRVALGEGVAITGVVKSARGEALAGATVSVREWRPERQHSLPRETQTNEQGEFTVEHMPARGQLTLSIRAKGYYGANLQDTLPFDSPLELTLIQELSYKGRVLDANSGEPVSAAKVEIATLKPSGEYWWIGERFTPVEYGALTGRFTARLNAGFDAVDKVAFVARVRAPGYRVAESTPLEAARLGEEVEIRLEPAPAVEGIVRGPDGAPLVGAMVAWAREGDHAFLANGAIVTDFVASPAWYETSDAEGKFSFAADEKPGVLVATHELGIAWLDLNAHEGLVELTLAPWVRVEGQLHAAKGLTPIAYEIDGPEVAGRKDFFSFVYNSVNTDEAGKFTIEKLPPMPMTIGAMRRWEPSHGVSLNPKPGETLRAEIGEAPGRVSGRFDLTAVAPLIAEGPEVLTDERHLTARAVPRGIADPTKGLRYIPEIEVDGAFAITGIPAGDYTLHVNVHATPPFNACGRGTPVGAGMVDFTVGENAVDLGTVSIARTSYPEPGAAAPEIAAKVLGKEKPWFLAEEKGKLVVLDFWATWCAPCVAAMPALKAAYEGLPADKVTVVGLNLDVDEKTALGFLEKKPLPWKQAYIGSWAENNPVTLAYGVSYIPSIWILDAEGKVLARDVKPEDLRQKVTELLQR